MPAKSKAQSRKLNATFGHEWVVEHGFNNSTKGLPERVGKKKKARKKPGMHGRGRGHH